VIVSLFMEGDRYPTALLHGRSHDSMGGGMASYYRARSSIAATIIFECFGINEYRLNLIERIHLPKQAITKRLFEDLVARFLGRI
jgi:hypothetical protein